MNHEQITDFDNDANEKGTGFCLEMLVFLNRDGIKNKEAWRVMKQALKTRNCKYSSKCKIYKKSLKKHGRQIELELNFEKVNKLLKGETQ